MILRTGMLPATMFHVAQTGQQRTHPSRMLPAASPYVQSRLECNSTLQNICEITGRPVSVRMAREIEALCSLVEHHGLDYFTKTVLPCMFMAKPDICCGFLAELRSQVSMVAYDERFKYLHPIVAILQERKDADLGFMKDMTFMMRCIRAEEREEVLDTWGFPKIFLNRKFDSSAVHSLRRMFEATPPGFQGDLVCEALLPLTHVCDISGMLGAFAARYESLPAIDRLYFARLVALAAVRNTGPKSPPLEWDSIFWEAESETRHGRRFHAMGEPNVFGTFNVCPSTLPNFKKAFLFREVSTMQAHIVAGRFTLCTNVAQAEYDFKRNMIVLTPESINRLRNPPLDHFAIFDRLGRPYFVKIRGRKTNGYRGSEIEIFNYRKVEVYAKNAPGIIDKCVDTGAFVLFEPRENRFYRADYNEEPLCLVGHKTQYCGDSELQHIAREASKAESERRMRPVHA